MEHLSTRLAVLFLCSAALMINPHNGQASPPNTATVHLPTVPREVPDDPPGHRSAVPPAGVISRSGPVTRGFFTSVQVNVDSLGNNIPGDAANESTIAVNPLNPNNIVIAWRQFDTVASNFRQAGHAFSFDGGQTWTFPGVLDPGQFRSDPVLAADPNGNIFFSSLSSVTSIEMFKSTDGGVTWLPPVPASGGDKQWLAADQTAGIGSGNIYQIWNIQFSCCGNTDFTRSTNGAASFEPPLGLPNPHMKWGTLNVGPNGTLYLAGATLDQTGHLFAQSTNAQDPAQTPTFSVQSVNLGGTTSSGGPNPAGLLGQVWVATDHSGGPTNGNIYILGSVNPPGPSDPLDVMFIRSTDGGASWSTPVRVNDDPTGNNAWQWFGTMSVAPNGRIDVVWNDTRNTGIMNMSELFYSFSTDAGVTWAPSIPLTPAFDSFVGFPNQNKIGDYYHMISDNTGADLAFAATFNGEQDVYFLRITQDCNGNGITDATDILNATSNDCNANGIPDECEIDINSTAPGGPFFCVAACNPDCNNNGIPDDCEIDCNDNGIPDDCDINPLDPDGNGQVSPDCQGDGIPDECQALDFIYQSDDGTHERSNGLPNGGNIAWLNHFLVHINRQTINAVRLAWGPVAAGTPATVYVWSDPNGDGSPSDAQVLASAVTTTENPDTDLLTSIDLPATFIGPVGTSFFVGVILSHQAGEKPISIDQDSPAGQSWIAGDGVNPIDPNNLSAASIFLMSNPPNNVNLVRAVSFGNDCNANGIPDDCEPDCNGNGVSDGCDISTGTSLDCNANTIPDECESPGCPGILLADMNCDGNRNGRDVQRFIDTLVNAGFTCQADMDQDGLLTLADVTGFVNAILIGP